MLFRSIITSLGIGEALVTALNEKGVPTPLAATMLRAPMSRMDILANEEIAVLNRSSSLVSKYSQVIDRESAYEILNRKIKSIKEDEKDEEKRKERERQRPSYSGSRRQAASPVVKVLTSATFIRGVLGILKKVM